MARWLWAVSDARRQSMSWPNLSDLLVDKSADAPVGLLGAPMEAGSVTPGRCDLAPGLLRATLRRIGRYDVETARELATAIADHGDVPIAGLSIEEATPSDRRRLQGERRAARADPAGRRQQCGDPARPACLRGLGLPLEMIGLITLDAHFDMRDTDAGPRQRQSGAGLLEDGLPGRNIAQIGLAPFANTAEMHRDAIDGGHRIVTIGDVRGRGHRRRRSTEALDHLRHCEAIVVDFDIDVIDRGQLPGAPGARPGGMAAHDFFMRRALARRRAAGSG